LGSDGDNLSQVAANTLPIDASERPASGPKGLPMLEVRKLRKRYGEIEALADVSFRIGNGETVGLLGPNGAGKTTTVSIICGLISPDSGEVLLDGHALRGDTDASKRKLGLVTQDIALYDELSATENLHFFGTLYNLKGEALQQAIGSALELVGLAERSRSAVKTFSGGMKRRLNLAAALLHDPQILLLDEPTVGVDPQSRNAIFENLETLRRQGKSLLYTTHYMEEAERLCDRVVIIDQGRVIADDPLRDLYRRLPATNRLAIELESASAEGWLAELTALPGVATAEVRQGVLSVGMNELPVAAPRVLDWLAHNGIRYSHVTTERADLESVFLSLTGRSLRDS
jgi:ABC-2 type transport system ATP-binding protein